jgi:hypothetical protein
METLTRALDDFCGSWAVSASVATATLVCVRRCRPSSCSWAQLNCGRDDAPCGAGRRARYHIVAVRTEAHRPPRVTSRPADHVARGTG